MKSLPVFAGIDVSKDRLDLALRPGDPRTVPYDDAGIQLLVEHLQAVAPAVIVLEATGGLELPLVAALAAAELPVVIANPRQIRDFAKAAGQLAKTDQLDAQVLAHFAEVMRPVPRPHEGQTEADLRLLGLTPGKYLYPIRPPYQARPKQLGELQTDTLWLSTRSTTRVIELAAIGVDVPDEHLQSGLAPTEAPLSSGTNLPLRIRHSTDQPASAYRIQHHGYWFYIDESDATSKQIFTGLVTLYTSTFGSKSADSQAPTLVLPISGG